MASIQNGLILLAVFHKGSVIGPILFVLYINDLSSKIICDVFMFADVTKVFRTKV